MSAPYETRNPLPESTRAEMIAMLDAIMADILDNHYQTLLAHWNVRGANFIALHQFFDEYAGSNGADNWSTGRRAHRAARRNRSNDNSVHRGAHIIEPIPCRTDSGEQHVEALATAAAKIIQRLRDGIALARRANDSVTADILAEVQRSAEKYLWLLEAHLTKARADA